MNIFRLYGRVSPCYSSHLGRELAPFARFLDPIFGARSFSTNPSGSSPEKDEALKNDKGIEATDKKKKSENDILFQHFEPKKYQDKLALHLVKFLRMPTDWFFKKKYGHRAVVLETIAAVPGMVGGMLTHMKSLRWMSEDQGTIKILLDEAQNERMHLMTFMKIAQPTYLERMLVLTTQGVFFVGYLIMYTWSPGFAHRFVGYLEEEAIMSYTSFLEEIDAGRIPNDDAPDIAIEYWNLPKTAKLRDVVIAVRNDERQHRDANHNLSAKMPIKFH